MLHCTVQNTSQDLRLCNFVGSLLEDSPPGWGFWKLALVSTGNGTPWWQLTPNLKSLTPPRCVSCSYKVRCKSGDTPRFLSMVIHLDILPSQHVVSTSLSPWRDREEHGKLTHPQLPPPGSDSLTSAQTLLTWLMTWSQHSCKEWRKVFPYAREGEEKQTW